MSLPSETPFLGKEIWGFAWNGMVREMSEGVAKSSRSQAIPWEYQWFIGFPAAGERVFCEFVK